VPPLAALSFTATANAGEVCPAYGDGTGASGGTLKIDTEGGPSSVNYTAPDGYLVSGYCVKAGSTSSDAGVEFISLDPPLKTVTISHSSGKAVSHHSVQLVKEPPPAPAANEWCSPGFWRANALNWGASAWPVPTDTLYKSAGLSPEVSGNPTLLDVLRSPKTYGGTAFNAVGTYLSEEAGLNVTTPGEDNCVFNQQGERI